MQIPEKISFLKINQNFLHFSQYKIHPFKVWFHLILLFEFFIFSVSNKSSESIHTNLAFLLNSKVLFDPSYVITGEAIATKKQI